MSNSECEPETSQAQLVLDASAVLSGMDLPEPARMVTTSFVVDEVSKGRMGRKMAYLLEAGLRVQDPTPESMDRVDSASKKMGESGRLSGADLGILALAIDVGGILLSDDYSIQNLASVLNISYKGLVQLGIKKEFQWTYRCRGCGRYYDEPADDCRVCGSTIRSVRKR